MHLAPQPAHQAGNSAPNQRSTRFSHDEAPLRGRLLGTDLHHRGDDVAAYLTALLIR